MSGTFSKIYGKYGPKADKSPWIWGQPDYLAGQDYIDPVSHKNKNTLHDCLADHSACHLAWALSSVSGTHQVRESVSIESSSELIQWFKCPHSYIR